jgi:DNA-directed RNA polymerase specialized sigma24 family protein
MDSSRNPLAPGDGDVAIAQDPPSSGRLPTATDLGGARRRAELAKGISPKELHVLLGMPDVQSQIRRVVRARLGREAPASIVDDIVQDANLAMLSAPSRPRSMETARGWITVAARRAVSHHFRRGAADAKWLVSDDDDDLDEKAAAEATEPADSLLLGTWLAGAVKDDPTDAETLELLLYKARNDATYDRVAADHGLTSDALRCRVNAFKTKYEARWRRHQAVLLLLLLLGAAAIAVAAWALLRTPPAVVVPAPLPSATATAPTAPAPPTATASAPDTPFEPANPTPRDFNDKGPVRKQK